MTGLRTPIQGRLLRHVAEDVLKWAKVYVFQVLILIVFPISQSRNLEVVCEAHLWFCRMGWTEEA